MAHFRNFFDAVRAGKQEMLHADVNETFFSTGFSLLGNISYRLGRKLAFNPEAELFIGDSEADAMLKCVQRSPYSLPDKV